MMMVSEQFLGALESLCTVRRGDAVEALDPGFCAGNLGAGIVALPRIAGEVAAIVGLCRAHKVSIVPHGGRTGLAGAGASVPGQLILDLKSLNRIGEPDPDTGTISVEAGATLQDVQEACASHGLTPGIDLAARGTATIGGMIATNAGGMEAFRCGVMRHRVLGLEAVLPDGSLLSDMTRVSKANEGLDIKQLLVGAEGRLGIITGAVLKLDALPGATSTALVSFERAASAVEAFHHLQPQGRLLRAEIMWRAYADTVAQDVGLSDLVSPFPGSVLVLFEHAGATQEEAQTVQQEALLPLMEIGTIEHAIIAQNDRQASDFWRLREESWAVERRWPGGYWYDVSVPLSALDQYVRKLEEDLMAIAGNAHFSCMGHLGDGNLHITVSAPAGNPLDKTLVDAAVFSRLKAMGGSFSAEHGIGLEKMRALAAYGDPAKLAAARAVKQALDPDNLMNPGKVLA
ncbi:FAD-linked oxidase C-terminal domain-containing protein [Anderseniella sp. Alg231-50]|uniref:FAD-linked oxidase C-terminal domain-containing protein n=1 Tax=Anderseniella sp. Alg231-50 TaxID=1922226 RepID=UPI000D5539AE